MVQKGQPITLTCEVDDPGYPPVNKVRTRELQDISQPLKPELARCRAADEFPGQQKQIGSLMEPRLPRLDELVARSREKGDAKDA